MRRFLLILCILFTFACGAFGASAESFTGRVTSIESSLGAPAIGIFGSPVGSSVSGSFLINASDFGPGTYNPNTNGYSCEGDDTLYKGQSSGSSGISLASASGTASFEWVCRTPRLLKNVKMLPNASASL